ncbi:hypothetical protein E2320_022990, partial [Naja naja]
LAALVAPDCTLPAGGGGILGAVAAARQQGELTAEELTVTSAFPVSFLVPANAPQGAAAVPVHHSFSLKAIRALKDAVKECGLHSRFTMGIVQSLSDDTTEILLANWQMLFS